MNRAKKLSGAEFKKKRRDRLEKDICNEIDNDLTAEVAATSLITDLNSYHPLELIEEEIFIGQSQDEFGPNDSEVQEDRNSQLSKPIEMGNSEFPPKISEISATLGENFQHSDPATWPKMTDKTSFVDFIESHEKTGKGLAAEITEKLEKDGLSISDCRGQGYDNGANMSGKYNGIQAHIHSLNEFARFVPCVAHTLNLVGVHAAEVSPLMITFFGKVQAIFNFFSSSTLRWEKLMKTLTISLKGNSDTRWSAKKEAIIPLHRQIKEILQVLESIIHTTKTNAVSVCSAKELIIQIDFSFLSKKIKGLKASIQNLRDVGVDNIIKAAAETAIQIGIEGDFPMKRKRKVKQMALYEAEDDFCRLSPETDFGSQCNLVFDSILTQIEWRFKAMSAVSSDFDFLSGHSLSKSSVDELKTKAKNLSKIYKADLDSSDFQSEMASFKYQAAAIHKHSLTDAYPNTAIAIRIFLTLPVTVVTCERSFSKLKIIKNYLRSTMGQERLSCLAVVSIEHEVANALDFDDVISDIASKKARKVTLN
ncbi:zinc finger MYM-type protein 1-like [Hydra vulgaris]|uniref:Zinc finger MYM-type protein 1-like n=1 Tax=Hydra vulgaris TaxID=6087 RepID=A0ABM4BZP4_HYDVU